MRRMLLWGMTEVEEAVFEVEEAVFEGSQRSCVVCFHFVLRCITSKEDGMVCRGFSQLKAGSQQSFNRDVGGTTPSMTPVPCDSNRCSSPHGETVFLRCSSRGGSEKLSVKSYLL